MSEIKWIKITTTMFEDEKIEFIESLPEADAILIIWIRLLTVAGKCNMKGHIFLTENIPYTDDMLAHKFRKSLNTVRLALETFRKLGMVEIDESGIMIANWEKHQNIDALEKIRDDTRKRVQKHRDKQKLLPPSDDCTPECNVTSDGCNVTDTLPLRESNALRSRSKKEELEKELYSSSTTSMTDYQEKIELTNDEKYTCVYNYATQKLEIHFLDGFDNQCVQKWVAEIPFDTIIEGIDLAFSKYKPSRPGSKIKNIRYCDGTVRDLHFAKLQRDQAMNQIAATLEGENTHGKDIGSTKRTSPKPAGPSAESRRLEEIARAKGLIRDGEIRNDQYDF